MADRGGEASTSSWQMFQQRALHAASQECGASVAGRRYTVVLHPLGVIAQALQQLSVCCVEVLLDLLASQVLPTSCRDGSSCNCSATSATEEKKEGVRPHVSPAPFSRLSPLPWCCWLPYDLWLVKNSQSTFTCAPLTHLWPDACTVLLLAPWGMLEAVLSRPHCTAGGGCRESWKSRVQRSGTCSMRPCGTSG